ncbi:MAG: hypothetical protein ACLSH6_01565 [Limosilactobacillus pontis]
MVPNSDGGDDLRGSVEFIIATLLTQHFNPVNVLLITAVVGFRQFFMVSRC